MKKLTIEEFIEKAKKIHGDKYDYSKVEYINARTKVCIICPKHGEFWQTPHSHLKGEGCRQCGIEKYSRKKCKDVEHFLQKAHKIHGDKYDYSKVEYVNTKTKVCIICPKHGEFWQTPNCHLDGAGCPKCYDERRHFNRASNTNKFIEDARKIHGNKYDYSKVEYFNNRTKVCIVCPTHGEFWQKPIEHLNGCGCSKCNNSILEENVMLLLNNEKITYEYRCHPKWLKGLELDFYLPQYNIAIECQGIQHFEPIDFFGGKERLIYVQNNDKKKLEIVTKMGITLLYYSNLQIDYPYKVITDKNKLLKIIKSYEQISKELD